MRRPLQFLRAALSAPALSTLAISAPPLSLVALNLPVLQVFSLSTFGAAELFHGLFDLSYE